MKFHSLISLSGWLYAMPRKDPLSAKLKKHSNCGKSCRRHHLIKLPKWCIVGKDLASAARTAWPSLRFAPLR